MTVLADRENAFNQFAIYEHPRDAPPELPYVVRRWEIQRGKMEPVPREGRAFKTLEQARAAVPQGLYRIPRQAGDDATIVEVWT